MSLPTFDVSSTAEQVADTFASDIAGKNVLVTGTSQNGIGFETARVIAKYANLVIITGYSLERLQKSAEALRKEGGKAEIRPLVLDLASLAAVRKAAAEVNAYSEPLHVLIHNAADTNATYRITEDDIEGQMAIDHLGPFLLTKLLYPKLLASTSSSWLPRIVIVASGAQGAGPGIDWTMLRKPHPGSPQESSVFARYHEAKSANVLFALALAKRCEGKLRAYSLHPGIIFSNIFTKEAMLPALKAMGDIKEDGSQNPDASHPWKTIPEGAATTLVAAFDHRLNDKSGAYLMDCADASETAGGPHNRSAFNSDIANADKLWTLSEEIVGEEFKI
ncbi:Short-chain dehydrogenase/reductase family protein [Mycena indigotica]|uniref:Short-chain dehydrogenase/reductase family protein n=1 Tax=Mycena indigotica TaxID=2126181 RepID=A0A8H6SIR9_9AGAR|nr:Short-chain dehydrogenase/reductase family protein [Mycena indigotica]KAF7298600.1 Short-chain dehydrogenase/reductase family protein [Mycena indigotica]